MKSTVTSTAPDMTVAEQVAVLNTILETSTGYSIIAMDLEGRILNWNAGARRNYGYSAEDMVSKCNARVLHTPADIESGRVARFMQTALETGKAERVFERVREDGRHFTASVALTLRRGISGKPIGFVLISKDITDQKRLEGQLRRQNEELEERNGRVQQANRLKSEFLANMSHELRTPLNAIIGFSELLHDGRAGAISSKQKSYVNEVLISARHLLQLINDVLDLSKVESGKMEFFPEPVETGVVVSEVRDILRTLTARKRINLQTEIDPELNLVVLDPAKFKQVLFNYLSNALKFTAEEGRVTIRLRPAGAGELRLEVEDTGIGIGAGDLPKLFEEFQQLDTSASKKYQGTGLGLALTKRIVEAQGGSVGVISTPGRGSLFFAQLPRLMPAGTPAVDQNGGEPNRETRVHRRRVLVIEDDPRDSQWLSATLKSAGYEVMKASTGREALRLLDERRFDALTLDLVLADMSGWEVLRRVRAGGLNQGVPAVLVSVVPDEGTGVGFAIRDFLEKPVKAEDLVGAVGRAAAAGAGKRILLVDDNRPDLKLFQSVLKRHGYTPIARSSARAALRVAVQNPPDLIVLDLVMPRVDGFEFLRRLRANPCSPAIPVIVLTDKHLLKAERELLGAMTQGYVARTGHSAKPLLEELDAALSAPRAALEAPSAQKRQPDYQKGTIGCERILIVDDNESNLRLMQAILSTESYEVRSARDAEEALRQLKNWPPRLILMDIQLPGLDGLELTRRLKRDRRYKNTVIVALTAYAMKGDKEKALSAGCDGYIGKPVDTRSLPGTIRGYIEGAPGPSQAGGGVRPRKPSG